MYQSFIVATNPMDAYATVLNRSMRYPFATVTFALNNTCLNETMAKKRAPTQPGKILKNVSTPGKIVLNLEKLGGP